MTHARANVLLLGIAVIWGLAFIFQKSAMEHIGPLLFVALRVSIAVIVLTPLAILEARGKARFLPAGLLKIMFLGGLMFFLGAVLQQNGLVTATVTNSGFLTGLYVIITPLLAWICLRKPPKNYVWIAVALAFAGTWLLGGGTVGGFSTGDGLVAISAIFWASHMLVVERSAGFDRPILFTAVQFIFVALFAGTGALIFEPISWTAIQAAVPELLFVGLLSSALTFTLMAVAMKHTPAPEAAILVSTETAFAAIAAFFILSERLKPIGWIGALLMFIATLTIHAIPYFKARNPPERAESN